MRATIDISLAVLALTVVGLTAVAFAEDRPREKIAVPPFSVTKRILEQEPEIDDSLAAVVTTLLAEKYDLPAPLDISTALTRMKARVFAVHGDDDTAVRLGRETGAARVLLGQAASFGDGVALSVRVLDVKTGRTTVSVMQVADSLEEVPDAVAVVLRKAGLLEKPKKQKKSPEPKKVPVAVGGKVGKLVDMLSSDDAGIRFSSAVELGKLGDKSVAPALADLLNSDRDTFVRRAAARSLGELDAWRAVPTLIDTLSDKEFFVSITAAKAIAQITGWDPGLEDGLKQEELARIVTNARAWWADHERDRTD